MFAQRVMHTFHQSPVSRAVRRVPGVNSLASKWWLRNQAEVFNRAFAGVQPPVTSADALAAIDVPAVSDIRDRDAGTVQAGDSFSDEMAQWCSTTKFATLGYQDVYGRVLAHLRGGSPRVLEVGIGVNDPDAASGMEATHQPGASLVGWSHYFGEAEVHGADIDRRVLIDTERYSTHYVDQRDPAALEALGREVGAPLDLVVDDGLHTAEANALTVVALLPLLSSRGVLVVEDILSEYDGLWEALTRTLNPAYSLTFFPGRVMRSDRGEGIAVFTRRV